MGHLDLGAIGYEMVMKKGAGWTEPLASAERDLKGIGQNISNVGESFSQAGKKMTRNVTLPIVAMGAVAVKTYSDFDKAMTESMAIMGDLDEETKARMSSVAREIATKTTFSADQAAEAYFFLASAGMDANQAIAAMPQVAKFAQAGAFDLATATDLVTDAQSAMGLTSKDAEENLRNMTRMTDVLTGANILANGSIKQFSEALTEKAGTSMKTYGIALEEGVGVLALFADKGVKGSAAGTQFSNVIEGLSTNAIKNSAAFKEYNVQVFDAEGKMRSLTDITRNLEESFAGMSDEERKAALMKMGFNKQALNGIQMMIGGSDAIATYTDKLENMGGKTEEVAGKQLESFWAQLELIKSQIADVGITIGETLAPFISMLAEKLAGAAEWFKGLSDSGRRTVLIVAAIAAAIGPLLLVLGGLISMIGSVVTMFGTIAGAGGIGAVAAAAAPVIGIIGAVLGVIALLAGAAFLVYKNWDSIKEKLQPTIDFIRDALSFMTDGFKGVGDPKALDGIMGVFYRLGEMVRSVKDMFAETFAAMKGQFAPVLDSLKNALEPLKALWEKLLPLLKLAGAVIGGALVVAFGLFVGILNGVLQAIAPLMQAVVGLVEIVLNSVNLIVGILTLDKDMIVESWEGIKQGIADVFSGLWGAVVGFLGGFVDGLVTFFGGLWAAITGSAAPKFEGGLGEWFAGLWDKVKEKLTSFLTGITTWFANLWDSVKQVFATALDALGTFLVERFGFIIDGGKAIFDGIVTYFSGLWEVVKNVFVGALLLLVDLVTGDFEGLRSHAMQIWDNIKAGLAEMWEGIKQVFSSALGIIVQGAKNAWTNVTNAFNALKNALPVIWEAVKTAVSNAWNSVKTTMTDAAKKAVDGAKQKLEDLKSFMRELPAKLKSAITNLPAKFLSIGKDVMNGIKNGLQDGLSSVLRKIVSITESIKNKFKSILGISSPSKVFADLFEEVPAGMEVGMERGVPSLLTTVKDVVKNVTDAASDVTATVNLSPSLTPTPALAGATSTAGTVNHYTVGNVTIDAKSVSEIQDVNEFFDNLVRLSRMG